MAPAHITHKISREHVAMFCRRTLLALAAGSLLLNACGGGGDVDSEALSSISCATGPSPAELGWDPVSHPDLAGYRVYYGTESGTYPLGPIDVPPPPNPTSRVTAPVPGLTSGETYYFVVTAYDTATPQHESGYSNVVCQTIP